MHTTFKQNGLAPARPVVVDAPRSDDEPREGGRAGQAARESNAPPPGKCVIGAPLAFAGGGTGGHIYPNLAILERLRERGFRSPARFFVSRKALDRDVLTAAACGENGVDLTPLAVRPWTLRPWRWPGFALGWFRAMKQVDLVISRDATPAALVATGGYVSGPPIVALSGGGLPVAMVNLDAVPGKANRKLARQANVVFSVYPLKAIPGAMRIGLPLRRAAIGPADKADARRHFDLDADRDTLLITGGSQGAQSINQSILATLERDEVRRRFEDWQVLHITGPGKADAVRDAYDKLKLTARVLPYCDAMGCAWRAATLAISRAGAGSVAEAWANAAPTVFLPYPFHHDDHQRRNAAPIVDAGGAMLLTDRVSPHANADQLAPLLCQLADDPTKRDAMARCLADTRPPDGAEVIADWLLEAVEAV